MSISCYHLFESVVLNAKKGDSSIQVDFHMLSRPLLSSTCTIKQLENIIHFYCYSYIGCLRVQQSFSSVHHLLFRLPSDMSMTSWNM